MGNWKTPTKHTVQMGRIKPRVSSFYSTFYMLCYKIFQQMPSFTLSEVEVWSILTMKWGPCHLNSPYQSKQVVKKFQDLHGAGVTVDWIAIRCISHHKSSSFCLFQGSGPTSSFYNSQNCVYTKAYLYRK